MNILNKKILPLTLALSLFAFMVNVASAEQTYLYVTNSSGLAYQVANSPEEAILKASNRDPNSGVMLVSDASLNSGVSNNNDLKTYYYVNIYGNLESINAANPIQAIMQAENRDSNSGVIEAGQL